MKEGGGKWKGVGGRGGVIQRSLRPTDNTTSTRLTSDTKSNHPARIDWQSTCMNSLWFHLLY